MAKQDDWLKVTVRIPPDLHRRLVEATGANSLNAEIVSRLERTLDIEDRNEAARQQWRDTKASTGKPPTESPVMEELSRVLAEEQNRTLAAVFARFGIPMSGDVPLPTPRKTDDDK